MVLFVGGGLCLEIEFTASDSLKLLACAWLSTTLKFEKKSVKHRAVPRL